VNERIDSLLGKGAIHPDAVADAGDAPLTPQTETEASAGTAENASSSTTPDWWWMCASEVPGSAWHLVPGDRKVPTPLCGHTVRHWKRARRAGPIKEWAMREMWGPLRGHPCQTCVRRATDFLLKET
jgi:hypothetical protein